MTSVHPQKSGCLLHIELSDHLHLHLHQIEGQYVCRWLRLAQVPCLASSQKAWDGIVLQGRIDLLPGTTLIVSCCTYPPPLAPNSHISLARICLRAASFKHLQPHTPSAVMAAELYHHLELGDPPRPWHCDGMPTLPAVAAQTCRAALV